jgi:hypothetical protein
MKINGTPPVRISRLPVPTREQVLATVRQRLIKLPDSGLVLHVDAELAAMRPVAPDLLDRARSTLTGYSTRQLEKVGIRSDLTKKVGLTPLTSLAEAFPLLGINKEELTSLSWATEADGIRNVRYHVFKNNPGLEVDVKTIEAEFVSGRYRLRNVYDLNKVRLRIIELITTGNLNRWGLGTFKNVPYFGTPLAVAARCFPFIAHSVFAAIKMTEQPLSREEFAATFYSTWKIGSFYRRSKRRLTDEQMAQHYSDLVVNAAATRKAVRQELFEIYKKSGGLINLDRVQLNSRWVNKYTLLLFYDLFGVGCADYLKTDFLKFLKDQLPKK